jgi:exonuclease III
MNQLRLIIITSIFIFFLTPYSMANGLKISTWHLEGFRGENSKNIENPNNKNLAFADFADKLNADLIAIQGIDSPKTASRLFNPHEYSFYFSTGSNQQKTGFAIRKNISFTPNPENIKLKFKNKNLPSGVDITVFHNKNKLRLLNIHLREGCLDSNILRPRGKACKTLAKQLSVLKKWVEESSKEDIPFIILGNFNRHLNKKDSFWTKLRDSSPSTQGLINPGFGKNSSCQDGVDPEYINHIILDKNSALRQAPDSFQELDYPLEEESFKFSPHCPISIEIEWAPSRFELIWRKSKGVAKDASTELRKYIHEKTKP